MQDIIIIGAGGFGREVEWLIKRINDNSKQWNMIGYADDKVEKESKIGNSKVYYRVNELNSITKETNIVIAVGDTKKREEIYNKIKGNSKLKFPNLIDPSVILGEVTLGIGNIICAGTITTVNVKIKNFTIINLDCTIGHDDVLNSFITIYPSVNVSGNVTIDDNTEIGTGTQIIQGKNICKNVIIGAGAVVVKNIIEVGTYVGIPAKKVER